jgi:thiol-disulfide isomerase/thioredoxin
MAFTRIATRSIPYTTAMDMKATVTPLRPWMAAALLMLGGSAAAVDSPLQDCRPLDMATGDPLDLTAYQGQVLYLDFWASWCPPCRASFPFMNKLHQELAGDGLAILAISVDETEADARSFLDKVPAEFPLALDTTGRCPEAFAVPGMPSSYVIGRDGSVLYRHTGFKPSDAAGLRQRIVETLGHPE